MIGGMPEEPSDNELLARIKEGDINLFAVIVERYSPLVFSVVRKHIPAQDVAEVAHETFIHAFKSLAAFRGDRPLKHWLVKIATRRSYDFWRSARRSKETPLSVMAGEHVEWLEKVVNSEARAVFDEKGRREAAREVLNWALSHLSAEDRMALSLVHLEGHSVQEAAEILGWSAANVKIRAHRSRKRLRLLIMELALKEENL